MRRGSVPIDSEKAPTRRYTFVIHARLRGVYARAAAEVVSPRADRAVVPKCEPGPAFKTRAAGYFRSPAGTRVRTLRVPARLFSYVPAAPG
jgi:hypothetical protein